MLPIIRLDDKNKGINKGMFMADVMRYTRKGNSLDVRRGRNMKWYTNNSLLFIMRKHQSYQPSDFFRVFKKIDSFSVYFSIISHQFTVITVSQLIRFGLKISTHQLSTLRILDL